MSRFTSLCRNLLESTCPAIAALAGIAAAGSLANACGRDGDTFLFEGRCIRLFGLDAPELAQPFGAEAAAWLQALSSKVTSCTRWYSDRYGREVARCRLGEGRGQDLGLLLVLGGYAWDWPQYSGEYYSYAQAEARRNKRGLWALPAPEAPWDWRKRQSEVKK